jgi:hypothetical protein
VLASAAKLAGAVVGHWDCFSPVQPPMQSKLDSMLTYTVMLVIRELKSRPAPAEGLVDALGGAQPAGGAPHGPHRAAAFAATLAAVGGFRALQSLPSLQVADEAVTLRMLAYIICENLCFEPGDAAAVERCGGFELLAAQVSKVFDPVSLPDLQAALAAPSWVKAG